MEGPTQWSEADTQKAKMVHVCIISHIHLSSGQGSSSACLKKGIFPLPHAPEQLLAEKTKDLVLLSASTLRQDAPEGLGSEELPKNKNQNKLFLFTDNPREQRPPEEDLGSLCHGQNSGEQH